MFFWKKRTTNRDLVDTRKEPAKISIIITAWDEKISLFSKAIKSIGAQCQNDHEIIVVINRYEESPEKTEALLKAVKSEPHVTRWCLVSQNAGVARAWNVGVHLSEGSLFLIMNGDCIVGKGALSALLQPFSDSKTGIVGVGGIRNGKKTNSPGPCDAVYGFLFAVRKKVYDDIGPFDNHFSPLADEEEYCRHATENGWSVVIAEGAEYSHEYRISNQVNCNIVYMGRTVERAWLDKRNNERKRGLPWMHGEISFKR